MSVSLVRFPRRVTKFFAVSIIAKVRFPFDPSNHYVVQGSRGKNGDECQYPRKLIAPVYPQDAKSEEIVAEIESGERAP